MGADQQGSIVLELQSMAADASTPVDDLLRKSLMVARKLKLNDIMAWIKCELEGYPTDSEIPEYRIIDSSIVVMNPYHGIQPVIIADAKAEKWLNKGHRLGSSVGSIVRILERERSATNSTGPTFPLTPEQTDFIIREACDGLPLKPVRRVSVSAIENILDQVRTRILNWTLDLEEQEILGFGLVFTKEEKSAAQSVVNNFHGVGNVQQVGGNMTHSTVNQSTNVVVKKGDLPSLIEHLRSHGVGESDLDELKNAIEQDPTPDQGGNFGPKVAAWIGGMMTKAANGMWDIAAGAAGGVLAQGISTYYGLLG
ncbi:MAG: hypothetical protein AAGJ38_07535 [Planctomycetota bacterium]